MRARKRFIIKPHLQIKYLLIALLVVTLTALAVYYAFWSSLIRSPGMEQLSAGEWKVLEHAYQTGFFWVVLILVLGIGIESIFLFHRLIGPLYVFQGAIRKIGSGDLSAQVHSRKYDELKDIAVDLQTMIFNIRSAVEEDRRKLCDIQNDLTQGNVTAAREKLAALTKWYTL